MTIVAINDNNPEGRRLMGIIRRSAAKSPDVVQIEHEDRDEDDGLDALLDALPQIPQLPYTKEEQIASVHASEEDYRIHGIGYTTEQMRAKYLGK